MRHKHKQTTICWGGGSKQEHPYCCGAGQCRTGHSDLMTDDGCTSVCRRMQLELNPSADPAGNSYFEAPEAK